MGGLGQFLIDLKAPEPGRIAWGGYLGTRHDGASELRPPPDSEDLWVSIATGRQFALRAPLRRSGPGLSRSSMRVMPWRLSSSNAPLSMGR